MLAASAYVSADDFDDFPRIVELPLLADQDDRKNPSVCVDPIQYLSVLRFSDGEVKLLQPLMVEVEKDEDGGYHVFSRALNLGGAGRSVEEAKLDLAGIVEAHLDELGSRPRAELHFSAIQVLLKIRAFVA